MLCHNYALDTMCWDKHTTFETNNLIQSNKSVFLLMQNYSQAFFQTEISDVIFAVVFAICCRPLQFDNWNVQKEREINSTKNIYEINFYSKKLLSFV